VGDILKVGIDEPVPADMLILRTSSSDDHCYVSTMNLDGETNLKVKKALQQQIPEGNL